MEWVAKAVGRLSRDRDRPLRDLYAPQPTAGQGGPISWDRNGTFFRPPLRGCGRDPTSVPTRGRQLAADLSISSVMLRAFGTARRSPGGGRAIARVNGRGGAECHALAQSRAPRGIPVRPAAGGRRSGMRQTRRLAAILAADVAGYSRLMGADEEGTHERLKAHRRELLEPKINEHSGRIVKTTGDGLLGEFSSVRRSGTESS